MNTGCNVLRIVVAITLIFIIIQMVPYGRDHSNPPVIVEPEWNSSRTRGLFFRSCKDCHSNATEWPWYSWVAPFSWLAQHDVDEGRSKFNVSEWDSGENEGHEASKMVRNSEMPLWYYLPLHPESRLTFDEREQLIEGLIGTFGESAEHEHGDEEKDSPTGR